MENPHNLPQHLIGMTQAKWDALTPSQRDTMRDTSQLHPKLRNLTGQKVKVTPKRPYGASTFRVGVSTGWRPCMLAVRANAYGSSDVINPDENFETVTVVR
jgi:hypothetical protein